MDDSSTVDDYQKAGLYDPDAPGSADRLALLEYLTEIGFGIDEMRTAATTASLHAMPVDSLRARRTVLTTKDMAERTGLDVEQLIEVRRAAGLAPVGPDVAVYEEADVDAFATLIRASKLFSWSALMQLLRVVGSSAARIADAANALFLHDVENPMRTAGAGELELAKQGAEAMELADGLTSVFSLYTRLHLGQAVSRSRQAAAPAGPSPTVWMAVGFVDLVGFTPKASELDPAGLADLVARFEATAHDLITDLGGRLVKLIGDEVMFVAVEASTGCDIAVALLQTFGASPALTPRGGLAYGPVLARSGDYYGPTVNLASRLTDAAVPGEVLATPEVSLAAATHHRVEAAGRRQLKGFAEPVAVVSLTAEPLTLA
ncbi:MAG: adenylate cyclase regulatory domain-containing protein [Ilumatobacteraceae bacterium]|nr:MAG: hypothetical protein IPM43_08060 [Actinomycetota bacterium]